MLTNYQHNVSPLQGKTSPFQSHLGRACFLPLHSSTASLC